MPRQGQESSLNKNKLLIAGLTLLVVSGFILLGACYGLVLTQYKELKLKMRDMNGEIRQITDTINDLGGTTNEPHGGTFNVNAPIDTLSMRQNENYQMLQRFEQSLAAITKRQKKNDDEIQNLKYPTKQPVGDMTVQGPQGVNHQMSQQLGGTTNEPHGGTFDVNARIDTLSRAQKENYQMLQRFERYMNQSLAEIMKRQKENDDEIQNIRYPTKQPVEDTTVQGPQGVKHQMSQQLAMSLDSLGTKITELTTEFGRQATDIANLRTDLRAANASMIEDFALLNESLNLEISVLHSMLDGMDNASDSMLLLKSKVHPITPSMEMIDLLHTKVENMSTAIVEVQDFLHNATALMTSINEFGSTDRNLLYTQLNNLENHLNGTSRDQQNMRENINSLYTQLDNLEKSTPTAMDESLQNFSNSFNHTLEDIESKMNQHIEMMASINDTASAERNSLHIQFNDLEKSTTIAMAENLQKFSTISNHTLDEIESKMNQHIEMMASMNDSASAERNSLYTQLENLDQSTTMAMADNLQNVSTILNHTLEDIESKMNQQIEMMASMNDSASAERNSLYIQLKDIERSTTRAMTETLQNVSTILNHTLENTDSKLTDQSAMIASMNGSHVHFNDLATPMVQSHFCGSCTDESSACTLGDFSELTCQRGFLKSHDGLDVGSSYTSFGDIRTNLNNPGFKGLKITLRQFDSNPPTNDDCDSDFLHISVSRKNFKHCGTAIVDLVLYFDVSAVVEGFIQISFLAVTNNQYSGFMIEFDFQLMPFPESAYKSTENDVVSFYESA